MFTLFFATNKKINAVRQANSLRNKIGVMLLRKNISWQFSNTKDEINENILPEKNHLTLLFQTNDQEKGV